MSLLSRLNRDTSRSKAFSSITNKLVIFENILLDRGRGGQISTPIYRETEPGVSCAKIGNQTMEERYGTKVAHTRSKFFNAMENTTRATANARLLISPKMKLSKSLCLLIMKR